MKHLIIPIFYIVFLIAAFVGQVRCIIKKELKDCDVTVVIYNKK